jgi:predicted dehydrogenase
MMNVAQKQKLNVLVIGYKNHARRIINHLNTIDLIAKIFVYHPNADRLPISSEDEKHKLIYTDDESTLSKVDAIFIASPSETHLEYIKKITGEDAERGSIPYVYCEKPPATNASEIEWLKNNESKIWQKVYFGFNFRFSNFAQIARRLIRTNEIGEPIQANFNLSHGIAFKKGIEKNWRFANPNIFSKITGNVGIHYADLACNLFGKAGQFHIMERNIAGHTQNDTATITMQHPNKVVTSIFLSYSTVYSSNLQIYFDDGILAENSGRIRLISPRDTFNDNGEFIEPEGTVLENGGGCENEPQDLLLSLNYFIDVVANGSSFRSTDFKNSLSITELFIGR